MEGCFMFQWGEGVFFRWGGLHFLWGGGAPHEGASILMGGGGFEKNCWIGGLLCTDKPCYVQIN